jgi:hypothetical protein
VALAQPEISTMRRTFTLAALLLAAASHAQTGPVFQSETLHMDLPTPQARTLRSVQAGPVAATAPSAAVTLIERSRAEVIAELASARRLGQLDHGVLEAQLPPASRIEPLRLLAKR